MVGDVLRENLYKLSVSSKNGEKAFWLILRDIAVEEIIKHGEPIDSDEIIPIYYRIMCENIKILPTYFQGKLPSNNQYRFRAIIRNLFSSNAFHSTGLANQKGILARKETNATKKGERVVYIKDTRDEK